MPVTSVPTSSATVAMATFITDVSSVIRNWPAASVTSTDVAPLFTRPTLSDLPARGERQREQLLVVGEPLRELEPRGGEVRAHAVARELGGDLGAQLLAAHEVDLEVERGDAHAAGAAGAEAHL